MSEFVYYGVIVVIVYAVAWFHGWTVGIHSDPLKGPYPHERQDH